MMNEIWAHIVGNKEWLFSGLGLALASGALCLLRKNKKETYIKQTQKSGNNSTNIQIGNDLNIGKENEPKSEQRR